MDLVVTEINEDKKEKEEEFDKNINKILNFMEERYSKLSKTKEKRKNYKANVNLNINEKTCLNMLTMIYVSLFGKPKDGKWDEKKINLIEQSLKEYEKN
mgnify:CR=1 FL=1|tara:strand:+ start:270 stop:566 length:297 start_codon:yes stop_codon:yes gene_type:complete